MNIVMLIGRIANDLELRYTPNNTACVTFALAIGNGVDKDGNERKADFPRIKVWGKQAETLCKYMQKGSQIAINGKIETGSYEKDGQKHYTTEVIALRVEFLGRATQNDESPSQPPERDYNEPAFAMDDSNIPF